MPKVTKQSAKKKRPNGKNKKGVIDRISPIGFDDDEGIKMLLYGRSGTGKTTLWATFPGPILAVICSGNSRPDELRSIDTPEYRKKIKQVTLLNTDEIDDIAEYARDRTGPATIVLDHVTSFQDLILKEILGLDDFPEQSSWGMATQQQYGQATIRLKTLLRKLLDLSCYVVIIGQERVDDVGSDSEIITPSIGVALTPSGAGWLNSACSYIGNTFIRQKMETKTTKVAGKNHQHKVKSKGVEYCLRTAPSPVYMTRFRIPKGTPLPDVIVDPDYSKIIKLIKRQGG